MRPDFAWLDGDWFDVDPCSSLDRAPAYYARDMVEAVRASSVPQEVGCHSFAHVMAGEPGCSREAFVSDLAACQALAGGELRSFVYPRNSVGHVDALAAAGFTAFRGRAPVPFAGRPAPVRAALRAADRARPLAGSAVRPARHASGVWDVPQTFLLAPATRRAWLPVGVVGPPPDRPAPPGRPRAVAVPPLVPPLQRHGRPGPGAGGPRQGVRRGRPPAGRGPPRRPHDGRPGRRTVMGETILAVRWSCQRPHWAATAARSAADGRASVGG